jgi:hypothetical protein
MNSKRKTAIWVGIFILIAYLMLLSVSVSPRIGLLLEVISGSAVIGTSILMYPLLKSKGQTLANGYLIGKFIEGGLMFIAGFFIYLSNISLYNQTYFFHAYFFIFSALFFYILLYRSKIVPRYLSIWGIVAAILLFIANLLGLWFDTLPVLVLVIGYAPIILNEVVLALFLIIRGFNKKK